MRLFLLYAVIELAVLVALVSTIGFGWTLLLVLATFVLGLALAGSQLRRQIGRLQSGLTADAARGAVTDSALVALGTVLVVIPGPASSVLGALLLLPPTRTVLRPAVAVLAARSLSKLPLVVRTGPVTGVPPYPPSRGDYIDGEVVDVHDSTPGTTPERAPTALPDVVERKSD